MALPLLLSLLHFLFLLLALTPSHADIGLRCKDHPALDKTNTPVLIRSWELLGRRTAIFVNNRIVYVPHLTRKFNYVPIPPPTPTDSERTGPTPTPTDPSPNPIAPTPSPNDPSPSPADPDAAAPADVPTTTRFSTSLDKYKGLDFFVMAGNRNVRSKFALRMRMQRPAKIYLFVMMTNLGRRLWDAWDDVRPD